MASHFELLLAELNSTSLGRRSFLAALPALIAACSSRPQNSESHSLSDFSLDDENLMARETLLEMRRDYPALQDSEIQTYLSEIGAQLVQANDLEGKPYNFKFIVVSAPLVNAFALPGGTVFITLPLLQTIESEAELAGVLGHEIGHLRARHAAQRIFDQRRIKKESWWYGTGGAVLGGTLGLGAASLLCPQTHVCGNKLVALGAAAGVHGGLLVQKYRFLANSRENELEADRIGFAVAIRAGYDANEAGAFYTRLRSLEKAKDKETLFLDVINTHPPSDERLAQWHELAATSTPNGNSKISSAKFEKIKKRAKEIRES